MREVSPTRRIVALHIKDDLIDESPRLGVGAGYPRHLHAGHTALQRLEQGLEVPHRENMRAHEDAKTRLIAERLVDRMGYQPPNPFREIDFVLAGAPGLHGALRRSSLFRSWSESAALTARGTTWNARRRAAAS